MLEILYYDTDIAVCIKPSGVLSEESGERSLPVLLKNELYLMGAKFEGIFPVHRLDKETSGLIVYALNSKSAAALSRDIQLGKMKKIYHALCIGLVEPSSARLCDLLFYDRKRGKSFVVDRKRNGVKEAELEYTVLDRIDGKSLLSVELFTGRTHQIRVQLASRGYPLCGDRRYGAPAEYGNSLCLCAVELIFPHPRTGESLNFKIDDNFEFGRAVQEKTVRA